MFPKTAVRCLVPLLLLALLTGCGPRDVKSEKAGRPAQAPPTFKVKFETSKGEIVVEVTRDLAPHGADRFHDLVASRFYDGARFFRVVRNFVAQFGVSGDPATSRLWGQLRIPDDPIKGSNRKGTLSFAMSGPATRTTQVFINLADNTQLDSQGFAPFGRVISGMDVAEKLDRSYGDFPPRGNAPDQKRAEREGNEYLERYFPRLDFIIKAPIEP